MAAERKAASLEDRIKEALPIHEFLLWRGRLEDRVMPVIKAYIAEMVVKEHDVTQHEDADDREGGDMTTHSSEFGLVERGVGGWIGNP